MIQPALTIAIPTYNRAHYLDRQLHWAVRSIADRWDQIELIASDNGSSDKTPEICKRWQQLTGGQLRTFRQPRNLGLTLNALHCIQQAHGRYIWLVSDDDEVEEHTFEWLLATISNANEDELKIIHLNGLMKDKRGRVILESLYNFKKDKRKNPGIYFKNA
jgi:glycosyltransferase involved in cell wall biosynthesis